MQVASLSVSGWGNFGSGWAAFGVPVWFWRWFAFRVLDLVFAFFPKFLKIRGTHPPPARPPITYRVFLRKTRGLFFLEGFWRRFGVVPAAVRGWFFGGLGLGCITSGVPAPCCRLADMNGVSEEHRPANLSSWMCVRRKHRPFPLKAFGARRRRRPGGRGRTVGGRQAYGAAPPGSG